MTEEVRNESAGVNRRSALKRIGAGAAIAWSAPAVLSMGARASAASPAPGCAQQFPNFRQDCDQPWTQTCNPPQNFPVNTAGPLAAELTASVNHCSSIIVHFFVDGNLEYTSPVLPAGASTGIVNLGPVAPGPHTFAVQAEGVLGGCNSGALSAWVGDISIYSC